MTRIPNSLKIELGAEVQNGAPVCYESGLKLLEPKSNESITMLDGWEMYHTNVDDAPAEILVDLGVAMQAPDSRRPWLLWMWLYLKSPDDDGFSTDGEEPLLNEIEDSFIAPVELTTKATLVGRITTCGRREFYFYCESNEGFEDSIAEAMQAFEDYEYEIGENEDSEWSHYTSVLYPEPENILEIMNIRGIEQLSEAGDPLTTLRTVDHHASFRNVQDRAEFVAAALAAGFTRQGEEQCAEPDEELPFEVTLQRNHAVDEMTINEMTFIVFDLAIEHQGQYEGWGSTSVPM